MRPPLERQEAERLVETYSDLVLRLSYSYLNQTQDLQLRFVRMEPPKPALNIQLI